MCIIIIIIILRRGYKFVLNVLSNTHSILYTFKIIKLNCHIYQEKHKEPVW